MALLKKKLFGDIIGGFGDAIYREREGLNYISQRPANYNVPMDAASIARRNRFKLTGKTAKSIYAVEELKELWKQVTPPERSTYPFVFSTNYKYVTDTTVTDLLRLVPGFGFGVSITSSSVDNIKVQATIGAIGPKAGINPLAEPTVLMTCVLFLSQPVSELSDSYVLLSLASDSKPTDVAQPLTFDAELTSQQSLIFDSYQEHKAFIAIVTQDASGNPVHYSGTVLLV